MISIDFYEICFSLLILYIFIEIHWKSNMDNPWHQYISKSARIFTDFTNALNFPISKRQSTQGTLAWWNREHRCELYVAISNLKLFRAPNSVARGLHGPNSVELSNCPECPNRKGSWWQLFEIHFRQIGNRSSARV